MTIWGYILSIFNKDIKEKIREYKDIIESLEAKKVAPEKEDDDIRRAYAIREDLSALGVDLPRKRRKT